VFRKFFLPFFVIQLVAFTLSAQNKSIDSLLGVLKVDKPDTGKVIHLNKLCREYTSIGNYDTAFYYGNTALQLAGKLNFQKEIAAAYNNIGNIYFNQGNYDKALENHLSALNIRKEINDKKGIAASYNNIGLIYSNQGKYDKALENHLASLNLQQETGNKSGIAASYNNIGLIYSAQENYDKALENQFAALKIRKEIGDEKEISTSYSNIGNIYNSLGNYEKSLENHLVSLKIRKEIGDKKGIASSYNNIGFVYKNEGKTDKSLENYFASLKLFEEIGDKYNTAITFVNIGNDYADKPDYMKAIPWLQKGMSLAKEIGANELLLSAYQSLANATEKSNDYNNAYKYEQLYSGLKDSIYNEKNSRQIAQMQIKYETEEKEKENKLLVQKNLLQQTEIEKRTLLLIILAILLFFTIIISFLLYKRYKAKQQALMERELNRQQQLRFKAIIDSEEKERRRIAQELHDGLGQLLSTAKLNISVLEETSSPNDTHVKNVLSLIDNAIDEVRAISHNMMPGVLIRLGLISALRELARNISDSNKIKVELNVDYDERLNETNEVAIYRIIQESTNNMIKYSKGTQISITLSKNKADLILEIKDNGIGFDTSLIETSSGIGWKNIYARTALLHGNIRINSEPSKGTIVNIHFPYLFSEEEHFLSLNNGKSK
jgi:two-component system NarL family sensor kinase